MAEDYLSEGEIRSDEEDDDRERRESGSSSTVTHYSKHPNYLSNEDTFRNEKYCLKRADDVHAGGESFRSDGGETLRDDSGEPQRGDHISRDARTSSGGHSPKGVSGEPRGGHTSRDGRTSSGGHSPKGGSGEPRGGHISRDARTPSSGRSPRRGKSPMGGNVQRDGHTLSGGHSSRGSSDGRSTRQGRSSRSGSGESSRGGTSSRSGRLSWGNSGKSSRRGLSRGGRSSRGEINKPSRGGGRSSRGGIGEQSRSGSRSSRGGISKPSRGGGRSSTGGIGEQSRGGGRSLRGGISEQSRSGGRSSRGGIGEQSRSGSRSSRGGISKPSRGGGRSSRGGISKPSRSGSRSSRGGISKPSRGGGRSSRGGIGEQSRSGSRSSRGGISKPSRGGGRSSRGGISKPSRSGSRSSRGGIGEPSRSGSRSSRGGIGEPSRSGGRSSRGGISKPSRGGGRSSRQMSRDGRSTRRGRMLRGGSSEPSRVCRSQSRGESGESSSSGRLPSTGRDHRNSPCVSTNEHLLDDTASTKQQHSRIGTVSSIIQNNPSDLRQLLSRKRKHTSDHIEETYPKIRKPSTVNEKHPQDEIMMQGKDVGDKNRQQHEHNSENYAMRQKHADNETPHQYDPQKRIPYPPTDRRTVIMKPIQVVDEDHSKRQHSTNEKHHQNKRSSHRMVHTKQSDRRLSPRRNYETNSYTTRTDDKCHSTDKRSLPEYNKHSPDHDRPSANNEQPQCSTTEEHLKKANVNQPLPADSKSCRRIDRSLLGELLQKGRQEILVELLQRLDEFRRHCDDEQCDTLKDNTIVVLAKVCDENGENTDYVNDKELNILLAMVKKTYFVKTLHVYIQELFKGDIRRSQHSIDELIRSSVIFIKTIVTKFQRSIDRPSTMLEAIQSTMSAVGVVDQDIIRKVDDLQSFINRIKQTTDKQRHIEDSDDDNDDDDIDVPNVTKVAGDRVFRDIPIYPTTPELKMAGNPDIKPNLIGESYESTDHYLDVQYRLLREDLVRPLRQTIAAYLHCQKLVVRRGNRSVPGKLDKDLWVYEKVTFRKISASEHGIAHTVKFTSTNRSWRKRLKFGTIVCLSSDSFETIFVAVVVKRDEVENGFVDVQFLTNIYPEDLGMIYWAQYTMLESSSVFFESYRYVLKGLCGFKNDNFPFKRYIIKAGTNVKSPKYLRDDKVTTYDIKSLLKSPKKKMHRVNIMEPDSWPPMEDTVLDESQYGAMRNALLKEVAVIQGPPGTGKTFMGLKLMEVLLGNQNVWSDRGVASPILIVCYTNHALDQFCEGVIEMNKLTAKEFVRLGSRSKNQAIAKCSKIKQRIDSGMGRSKRRRMQPLEDIVLRLNELSEGILHIATLSNYRCLTNHQIDAFSKERTLHRWLWIDEYDDYTRWMDVQCSRTANLSLHTSQLKNAIEELKGTGNESKLRLVRKFYKWLEEKLENLAPSSRIDHKHAALWNLNAEERWSLYAHWVETIRQRLYEDYLQNVTANETECENDDFLLLSGKKVIAATTSAASKNVELIRRLKPKIVIVEEAARILEAHVISALTSDCEHLIMIGDHQQLRPETASYDLRKRYHLDVSLFERLILNSFGYDQLKYQHRMPPNISNIVRTVFYKNLKDTSSMKDVDMSVEGAATNLMLINHKHNESSEDDIRSRSNKHEAEFIVGLTVFLVQQGYRADSITMLTPYVGQSDLLRKLSKSEKLLTDVKIKVLDNYQGEENDIIMLSLVRSNNERKLGFLKDEKRVCVMLSRAKKSMYCIGNFQMLGSQSLVWKRVIAAAELKNNYGTYVEVSCKNHQKFTVQVRSRKDFEQLPDGGCLEPCDHRLQCGHVCPMTCHPYDREHREVICSKDCDKTICSRDHKCDKKCGEPCRKKCLQKVEIGLPCGHRAEVKCFQNPDDIDCQHVCVCPQPCNVVLKCGHTCKGKCGKCMNGLIHIPCNEKCSRILVCGHTCTMNCCVSCPPCKKPCENRCSHSRCYNTCGERCVPCKEECKWSCEHEKCTQPCGSPCDRNQCDEPCTKTLSCKHPCIGLCGEPCPSKCRICHKDEVQEMFFGTEDEESARFIKLDECGHLFECKSMDKWMMGVTGNKDTNIAVQMKECPKCKTTIRKSLRYGDVIKAKLRDIELVKDKMKGEEQDMRTVVTDFRVRYNKGFANYNYNSLPHWFRHVTEKKLSKDLSLQEILDMRNKLEFQLQVMHFERRHNDLIGSPKVDGNGHIRINRHYQIVEEVLKKYVFPILTEQQLDDISLQLRLAQAEIRYRELRNTPNSEDDLGTIRRILDQHFHIQSDFDELKSRFVELRKRSGLGVTDDERLMIVKAMDLSRGHWYKCPNNHVYAIGECGGATQESKCPECKESIGGKGHKLTEGNTVASEMDGARHAAWSEAANLDNFNPNEFI